MLPTRIANHILKQLKFSWQLHLEDQYYLVNGKLKRQIDLYTRPHEGSFETCLRIVRFNCVDESVDEVICDCKTKIIND